MPARVPGSSHILAQALAGRIHYVGTQIGRNDAVVEKYTRPQPSKEHPHDTGIPNPIDILVRLIECTDAADEILGFVEAHFGRESVRKGLVQKRLVVSEADVTELSEQLTRELRRRTPNPERLRNLRDELADVTHKLVAGVEAQANPGERGA